MTPQTFDDAAEIAAEIRILLPRIDRLAEQMRRQPAPAISLVLALRLEYYLLNPRFQQLFHCLSDQSEVRVPEEEYEVHLGRLLEALAEYGHRSPELELLGETVGRIWEISRQALHHARIDYLTGTLNRRGLLVAIQPLIHLARRNRHPVGVLMADIDNFKAVNDTYGHQKGDEVIAVVARSIATRLRASDVLGRYGGEEFLAVMAPVDPGHLERIAEDVRLAGTAGEIPVTLSIGIAHAVLEHDVEREFQTLVRRADTAMLEAKGNGKNRVVVHRQPGVQEGLGARR
jgi:diguanylate cyclase (GGDEF)-like protein